VSLQRHCTRTLQNSNLGVLEVNWTTCRITTEKCLLSFAVFSCYCFCHVMLCISMAYAVMWCLSIRPSITFMYSVKTINISSIFFTIGLPHHSIFYVPNAMAIFQRRSPNEGVECRWGRKKSRFSTNIWLCHDGGTIRCYTHSCARCGKLVTFITDKRPRLLFTGDDNEVFMTKAQHYAEDDRAAFDCIQW